jgi:AcrR family transcriptional regulator
MSHDPETAIEPRRARGRPTAGDLQELEARLVRVARQCFLADGYGATSMNAIAKVARVSKGTLYARFSTKADVFRAIIEEQIAAARGKVRLAGPRPRTLEAALVAYAETSLRESLRPEIVGLNRLIYSEAGRFPELGEAAWARTREGVRQVTDLIRDYAAKDGVACRAPEVAAEMFTTSLRGFYGDLMQGGPPPAAEGIRSWARETVTVFLAGRAGW